MNQLEQGSTARPRLNLSPSAELMAALEAAALMTGLPATQIAMQAIIAGMPKVVEEATAIASLGKIGRDIKKQLGGQQRR